MYTTSALFGPLDSDNNDHFCLGVLTVLVLILHALLVMLLLQPSDNTNINKPVKVVEVVILPPEPNVPKEKAAPPAPAKPVVQKTVAPPKQPPKKIMKPVVKKEAVVPKKTTPIKPVIEDRPSVLTMPNTAQKPTFTAPPSASPATKPAAKLGNGDSSNKGVSSGVALISRVKPVYPARATSRHIEGWVKIEFTVTPSGTVSSPSVVSASPPGIFDSAALDAIMKWKFKPKMVNGQAVAQRAVQTVKFTLSK